MTCSSFPGPGDKHIYTFNPMAEFIHPVHTGHVDFEFNKFMHKHRKQYGNENELNLRKEIFRQNIRFIHAVNRQNKGQLFCFLKGAIYYFIPFLKVTL